MAIISNRFRTALVTSSQCPPGERFDEIEQKCVIAEASSPTDPFRAATSSSPRCPEGERYDDIEQMCVLVEPEDISEDGFSAPVRTAPVPTSIPESDPVSPASPVSTVPRGGSSTTVLTAPISKPGMSNKSKLMLALAALAAAAVVYKATR